MLPRRVQVQEQLRLGPLATQPVLTTSTQNSRLPKGCAFTVDISKISGAVRGTKTHLISRQKEISQWQSQILECVGRINQEIGLMEQMIESTESCLGEQQQYGRLVNDCVSLCNSITVDFLKQQSVMAELRRENDFTSEVKKMLQKQLVALKDKLSSLKRFCAQLLSDYQDKTDALTLTTKCITYNLSSWASRLPASQFNPNNVSYDHWLTNCIGLKTSADKLTKEASSFRTNMRFTLNNVRGAQQCQRQKVDSALRKAVHNLKKAEDAMFWESHQLKNEIGDLQKNIQKMTVQMRNCDTRLLQATHGLELLNQRPRHELCIDRPLISLTLEKSDLTNITIGLCPVLNSYQQELTRTIRRLRTTEDKLSKNANALDVMYRCQNLHQNFPLLRHNTPNMTPNPRTVMAMSSSFSR